MQPLLPTAHCLLPRRGQTALSMVFVIGGIIVLFGTTMAFLALSFLNSTYGFQAANRAATVAQGGIQDTMLQLERDKDFSSAGYCVPYNATLPCPSGSATVIATQGSPSAGKVTVTSEATVSRYRRKFQAIFAVNASTSIVHLLSSSPLTL